VSKTMRGCFAGDERVRRLIPIPGIGLFSAATVVGEIWDVKRFPLPRQLASWAGLTPKEHPSGEHRHQGHIAIKATSPSKDRAGCAGSWSRRRPSTP
jgi:transposase